MLCDKADCNYYDSSMEYNCAWGNDGSSSIMCMTHDYKRYCQRPLTSKSGYVSGVNYKQLYDSEKHLRELSEARFGAAEELLVESKDTILYIKQYVDGRGLSAEDDGDNMIKAINDFLGVINE